MNRIYGLNMDPKINLNIKLVIMNLLGYMNQLIHSMWKFEMRAKLMFTIQTLILFSIDASNLIVWIVHLELWILKFVTNVKNFMILIIIKKTVILISQPWW